MDHFPIFLKLKDRRCLVVGGGDVAARKIDLLLQAGARISVVSPKLCRQVEHLVNEDSVVHIQDSYRKRYIKNNQLVIAATNDSALNQKIFRHADKRFIPVNVVDDPDHCRFITPAIIDRSPVIVAVSTGGSAPVLATRIRSLLEQTLPQGLGRVAQFCARWRSKVKTSFSSLRTRRIFWQQFLESPLAKQVEQGVATDLDNRMDEVILAYSNKEKPNSNNIGSVSLVGAGPGDAELLTMKALRLLQTADVIVYDRLVSQEVANLARRDAERIFVGKREGCHPVPQHQINQMLVELAREGKTVVRLKGGDPFIFARGGEEAEALAKANIRCDIVPGISASAGCGAYAGIPLTHRDYASAVTFVTGHKKQDGQLDLDWATLVNQKQTLAIYMGVKTLPHVVQNLVSHGRAQDTPVAVVENGTTEKQRVITGTLANIESRVITAEVSSPAMIIIGEVVRLHHILNQQSTSIESLPDQVQHSLRKLAA